MICEWIVEVDESMIQKRGNLIYRQLLTDIAVCIKHVREKREREASSSTES